MKKKKMKDKTYSEIMDELLACKTQKEAKVWFEVSAREHAKVLGFPEVESARIFRERLGYMLGFYDDETARRAQKLLGLTHPILPWVGKEKYTSEKENLKKAFEAGVAFGKKHAVVGLFYRKPG